MLSLHGMEKERKALTWDCTFDGYIPANAVKAILFREHYLIPGEIIGEGHHRIAIEKFEIAEGKSFRDPVYSLLFNQLLFGDKVSNQLERPVQYRPVGRGYFEHGAEFGKNTICLRDVLDPTIAQQDEAAAEFRKFLDYFEGHQEEIYAIAERLNAVLGEHGALETLAGQADSARDKVVQSQFHRLPYLTHAGETLRNIGGTRLGLEAKAVDAEIEKLPKLEHGLAKYVNYDLVA